MDVPRREGAVERRQGRVPLVQARVHERDRVRGYIALSRQDSSVLRMSRASAARPSRARMWSLNAIVLVLPLERRAASWNASATSGRPAAPRLSQRDVADQNPDRRWPASVLTAAG
jgi:hypothetical protein